MIFVKQNTDQNEKEKIVEIMIEDNQLACLVIQKRSLTKDVYAIDSNATTDEWIDG